MDRSIIDRALEEPSFGVILQNALIGSAQTESQEKHELLANLVATKLAAPEESLRSIVTSLACEALTHLTHNQLKILGVQSVLTLIYPSFNESHLQTESDFLGACDSWLTSRLSPFLDVQIRRIDLLHPGVTLLRNGFGHRRISASEQARILEVQGLQAYGGCIVWDSDW